MTDKRRSPEIVNDDISTRCLFYRPNVSALSPDDPPLHIIVGGNSGITGWDSLKGKRVNIGNAGSGQRGTMDFLMKRHGWSKNAFKLATELTSTEQSKALWV